MAGQRCLTHGLWDALGDQIAAFLDSVTLQEVLDGIPRQADDQPCACDRQRPRSGSRNERRRAHISTGTRPRRCGREARAAMRRGARRRRQSLLAARRRPARARHRRGCARAGGGAGRRQAGRGGVHQRRHGGQQRRAGRAAGTTILLSGIEHDSVLAPARRRQGARRRAAGRAQRRGARGSRRSAGIDATPARDAPVAADRQQRDGRAAAGCRGGCGAPRRKACCAHRCRAGRGPHPRRFARARRRLSDAVRRTSSAGRRASARWSSATAPACRPSSPAAARSAGAAPAPRTWRPSPASARRPRRPARSRTHAATLRALRDAARGEVRAITPGGRRDRRGCRALPNTTNIALPGASAETLVIALDLAGIAVSAGAACSSGKVGASHVLEAMGLEPIVARAAIRVSLGWSYDGTAMSRPSSRRGARLRRASANARSPSQRSEQERRRMAAVQQTIDQVKRIDVDQYKYGFETDDRVRQGAAGPERGYRPLHLGEEGRAGLDAGVAAGGLSALADHDRADLGQGALPQDRLPGPLLLLRAEIDRRPQEPRRGRSRSCCAPTRSSASRSRSARSWPA